MKVEFGNIYYILYIGIIIAVIIAGYFLLRDKEKNIIRRILLIILFLNFALHFLKLLFNPYVNNLPNSIHKATLENLCAVSTVLFPFIFMIKKHTILHDYMYFIGLAGGIAALIYPTEALGESPFAFDTLRFYFCHGVLFAIPLLSAILGIYKPRLSCFWAIPLLFLAHEAIILLNEIVLIKTGLIDATLESFLSRDSRNNSFIFGPTSDFDSIAKFLTVFVPEIFTKDIFGINGGNDFYWPIIWIIGPAVVYFIPIYTIFALPVCKELKVIIAKLKAPFQKN